MSFSKSFARTSGKQPLLTQGTAGLAHENDSDSIANSRFQVSNISTPTFFKSSFARFLSRDFRRKILRKLMNRALRSADAGLAAAGQLQASRIHRILVLRPNHRLGNILLLTPLLSELQETFPGAEIDVLAAGDVAQDMLGGFTGVRYIHCLPRYIFRHLIKTSRLIASLRRARYDLAIDPIADSNSNRLLLAWIKPRNSIGIPAARSTVDAGWAGILFLAPRHLATLPVFLLRHALVNVREVNDADYPRLDIRLSRAERRIGQTILNAILHRRSINPHSPIIGIFANATGAKCLDKSWWLKFLSPLIDSHPEYTILEFVPADGTSRLGGNFPTYYSSDPRKLASVISNLTSFISGDCGVMHLACASGVPTIGLFSVTDASMYEPYGNHNHSLNVRGRSPADVSKAATQSIELIARNAIRISKRENPSWLPPATMNLLQGQSHDTSLRIHAATTI